MRNFLLNRQATQANADRAYPGWKAVKTVQIIYDESEEHPRPDVQHLIEVLKKEGKRVKFLAFNFDKKPKENIPESTFYKADKNLLGLPKKKVFTQFNELADVFIDWTQAENTPNDFLAFRSQSGFKLGIGRELPVFDMLINSTEALPGKVIEEVLKYLKMINHE